MLKNWRFVVLPWLAWALISLIGLSCRVRRHNDTVFRDMVDGEQPFILSMWHNSSTIAGWALRNNPVTVIVSDSRDGEYVARMAKLFGIGSIRGSSSSGSPRVIRDTLKLLGRGQAIGITPDGPRGPKYRLQSGLLWFAASHKVPIIPLHIEADRQWIQNSWDRQRMPKPFSKMHVCFGDPVMVDRAELEMDLEPQRTRVQTAMMENVARAQSYAGFEKIEK